LEARATAVSNPSPVLAPVTIANGMYPRLDQEYLQPNQGSRYSEVPCTGTAVNRCHNWIRPSRRSNFST
jgi:hypothetical protein